jgi:DNA-binding transcriptional ArsR family regulator
MPNEFDFKNYKSMEEFSQTMEGTKYLHDLYLKAVNHPVRREILEIVNKAKKISKKELLKVLIEKNLIKEENQLVYNVDYLLKAFCITSNKDENGEIFYEITQSGKVIEYLE